MIVHNGTLRFLLDGDEVPEYLSVYALELEDQDQIDAIFSQIGCWAKREILSPISMAV